MLRQKGLGEINQIRDNLILAIRPLGGEFKAVAGLFALAFTALIHFLDMAQPGCIRIIFRMRPVGNDKDLDIFIKSACRPETVALVALDLIECLTNRNAASFELHMDQGQAVDKNRHIIARIVAAARFLILVHHLQTVVMYILFIKQGDVLARAVITVQNLYMIFLNRPCFGLNTLVHIGNGFFEESIPFPVRKCIVVQ